MCEKCSGVRIFTEGVAAGGTTGQGTMVMAAFMVAFMEACGVGLSIRRAHRQQKDRERLNSQTVVCVSTIAGIAKSLSVEGLEIRK